MWPCENCTETASCLQNSRKYSHYKEHRSTHWYKYTRFLVSISRIRVDFNLQWTERVELWWHNVKSHHSPHFPALLAPPPTLPTFTLQVSPSQSHSKGPSAGLSRGPRFNRVPLLILSTDQWYQANLRKQQEGRRQAWGVRIRKGLRNWYAKIISLHYQRLLHCEALSSGEEGAYFYCYPHLSIIPNNI